MRHVPVEGVVLTDAELDHTLGILLLREGRFLQIHATAAVCAILERDSRIVPVTRAFAEVRLIDLALGQAVPLAYRDGCPSGLTVTSFAVPAGPPRFAGGDGPGHTVGVTVRDEATGGTCAFVPGCGDLDPGLLEILGGAELVLFDGTFWSDDELIGLGIGERTARQMDHLPVSGPGGQSRTAGRSARPAAGLHPHQQHQSDAGGRLAAAPTGGAARTRRRRRRHAVHPLTKR